MRCIFSEMKWFAFLQAIFFVTACTDKPQDTSANTYTLEYAGSIAYPLDSITAHDPLNIGLNPWNDSIFYLTNRDMGRVHFYNAYTQEKIGYWHFTSDPRNNLTGSLGIFLIGKDSLMVVKRPLVLNLFSAFENDVIHKTEVELPKYDERRTLRNTSVAGFVRPIRESDSTIIIKLTPAINAQQSINPSYTLADFTFLVRLNIYNGVFEDLPLKYPESSKYVISYFITPVYMTEAEDYFVVGFVHDPILYKVAKPMGHLLGTYSIPSIYNVDFSRSNEISVEKYNEFREKNYGYFQIVYDPYRRVFYRQVLHPNHDFEIGTRYFSTMDRPAGFSVMIFDEEFKKLGEVDFPPKTYGYQAWYVGPEGLYISKSNYNNPEMREDFMDFDLFVLTPLEE